MKSLKYIKKGGIKRRLVVRLVGFTAVSMLSLTIIVSGLLQQTLTKEAKKNLTHRAEAVLELLEQRLAYLQENTERLTSNHFVVQSIIDLKLRNNDLLKLVENFADGRDVKSFGLVDFGGKAVFELGLVLPNYNQMIEMRAALAKASLSMFISDNGDLIFVSPIEYYQTTQGAVVVVFDLNAILARTAPSQTSTYITLLQQNKDLISIGKDKSQQYVTAKVTSSQQLRRLNKVNLSLEMGELESVSKRAIQQLASKVLLITTIFIVLSIIIAVFLGNSLSRPIITLYNRVIASINGSSVQCSPLGTGDELDDLATAFDERTHVLEVYQEGLEKQVKQRTKELEATAFGLVSAQHIAKLGSFRWNISTGKLNWSDEHYRLLGCKPESVKPSYEFFMSCVHEDDKEKVLSAISQAIELKGSYVCEHRIVLPNNTVCYMAAKGQVDKEIDSGDMIMEGTIQDVTEKINYENELKLATEQAKESSKAKSQFLAMMSHEIRTPMNGIIGMTHLALQGELNEKEINHINKAHTSAKNLLVIINDILDFSKIEAGKMELEITDFSLKEVIDNVISHISLKAKEKNILIKVKLDPDLPKKLNGDPLRIGQILTNLASNAVKFSHSGDAVTIGLELTQQTNEGVRLQGYVHDTGIGMNEEQRNNIFQPFTQADSGTTRKYGGTGLGLVISHRIAELMQGKVWVDSEEGVGSTFYFTIDLQKAKEHDLADESDACNRLSTEKAVVQLKGAKILLVEDNDINQELIIELLSINGMKVVVANNGQEALNFLETNSFDGVLMDCMMPVMDGYEATEKIRQQDKYAHLPILAMTANVMKPEIEKAINSGMNDHIAKPVLPDVMIRTMAKWIKK